MTAGLALAWHRRTRQAISRAPEAGGQEFDVYRTMINRGPTVVFLWRVAECWPVDFVSENVAQFGYTPEELYSGAVAWPNMVHPDDVRGLEVEVGRYIHEGVDSFFQEYRIITKSGEVRWVVDHTVARRDAAGCLTHFEGIILDITKRKLAENALRESEAMERGFQQRLKALHDIRNTLSTLNALEQLWQQAVQLGAARLGFDRLSLHLVDPDDTELLLGVYAVDGETTSFQTCRRRLTIAPLSHMARIVHDHHVLLVEDDVPLHGVGGGELGRGMRMTATITEHDRLIGWVAADNLCSKHFFTAHDQELLELFATTIGYLHLRLGAEMALASEKERLTVTLRSIGDGVITTDQAGRVMLLNTVAEELTGWTQEAAAGKPLADVFHIINAKTYERCDSPVERVLETQAIVAPGHDTALMARSGAVHAIADSGAPIFDRDGHIVGVVLVFRDVTQERRVAEEMQKADKLDAIGILAGGIAHDFNNLLTAVIGNMAVAKMQCEAESLVAQRLSEAEKAAWRARDLTQQLLTFSKGGAPVKRITDLSELVRDTTSFTLSGSAVRCILDVPGDLWPADVDPGQITQVVSNLVINAEQAMPDGGTLMVAAENVYVAEPGNPALQPGPYVKIRIADTGMGIPDEQLSKIFDPYFTTKENGNGLGLATAYSIITSHQGVITVNSVVGVGTDIVILLSAVPGALVPCAVVPAPTPGVCGRILVLDDEPGIREMLLVMLRTLGYEATGVSNGEAAITCYEEARAQGAPFDVLIADLTIPGGVGGKEVVAHLRAFDRQVHAIVSSGYSTDPVMAAYREYGFDGVLVKPYCVTELQTALHAVMGERDAASEHA